MSGVWPHHLAPLTQNGIHPAHILVLGIGNVLRGDDGIGIRVLEHLIRHHAPQPGVTFLDGGTLGFALVEPIAHAQGLILIDAAQMDAPPGTIQVFHGAAMNPFLLSPHGDDPHAVGVREALGMAHLLGNAPLHVALVAIQPAVTHWHTNLSDAVQQALPYAIQSVQHILNSGFPPHDPPGILPTPTPPWSVAS
jgi:hydrogenase maturation protease